jgi:hypothetical protein
LSDDYPNGQRSVASEIIIRILAAIGFPGSRPIECVVTPSDRPHSHFLSSKKIRMPISGIS